MDIILKIIGAIALGVVGLIVLGVILIAWKWKSLKAMMGTANPSKISLRQTNNPKWIREPEVSPIVKEIEDLGFKRGNAYVVDELSGVNVFSFLHNEKNLTICLYKHKVAGLYIDCCAKFEDGRELTVTNASMGSEIKMRPEAIKVWMNLASVSEVVEEAEKRVAGVSLQAVSRETFRNEFEESYKKDMQFMAARGGISEEEIRKAAENQGAEISEEVMLETIIRTKAAEIRQWEEECLEAFEKTREISKKEWEKYTFEDDMVIFSETFHPKGYLEYLSDTIDIDDEELDEYMEKVESMPLFELFNKVAKHYDVKIKKLGHVDTPVSADIYGVEE